MKFTDVTRSFAVAVTLLAMNGPAIAGDEMTTQAVLEHHLSAFGARDMDAFLSDYTDSSVIFVPGAKFVGTGDFQAVVQGLFEEFGQEGVTFEMMDMQVDGPVAYVVWRAETPNNSFEMATDTFVIEDGKIVYQTFAAKKVPKQ